MDRRRRRAGASRGRRDEGGPAWSRDKDRAFWSFQPAERPAVPEVRTRDLVRNPIDAILLAQLEAKSSRYSPEARASFCLRRASLDLTGLPPTPEEIEAYRARHSSGRLRAPGGPSARLAALRRALGQFWLNAAGYADSEGIIDEDRIRPNAWRYRDYVIRSFNADKPYDQFLTEQIAGDELVDYRTQQEVTPETWTKAHRHRLSALGS